MLSLREMFCQVCDPVHPTCRALRKDTSLQARVIPMGRDKCEKY
jgi:hypothetical protein